MDEVTESTEKRKANRTETAFFSKIPTETEPHLCTWNRHNTSITIYVCDIPACIIYMCVCVCVCVCVCTYTHTCTHTYIRTLGMLNYFSIFDIRFVIIDVASLTDVTVDARRRLCQLYRLWPGRNSVSLQELCVCIAGRRPAAKMLVM